MPELNAKILIVYSDESVRVLLTTTMEREGLRVLQASNGTTGLDMIRRGSPDLMLVEIKMSDLDGIAVLREARDLNPNLLITAITAYGDCHSAPNALEAGAHSYLEKPFPVQEVNKAVRQVLLNKQLRSQVKTNQAKGYLPQRELPLKSLRGHKGFSPIATDRLREENGEQNTQSVSLGKNHPGRAHDCLCLCPVPDSLGNRKW